MQEFYDSQSIPLFSENWALSEIAVAKSEAQKWYRCRILDPESLKVFYLDYGYIEIVEKQSIRKIDQDLSELLFKLLDVIFRRFKLHLRTKIKPRNELQSS